jgi:hypothetical protein
MGPRMNNSELLLTQSRIYRADLPEPTQSLSSGGVPLTWASYRGVKLHVVFCETLIKWAKVDICGNLGQDSRYHGHHENG